MALTEYVFGETSTTKGILQIDETASAKSVNFLARVILQTKESVSHRYRASLAWSYWIDNDEVTETAYTPISSDFVDAIITPWAEFTATRRSPAQQAHFIARFSGNESGYESVYVNVASRVTFTITYSAGSVVGVTNLPSAQTKEIETDITLSDQTPLRTGYNFTGWNTAEDGTGMAYAESGTYSADADVTLYAQWEPVTYRIVYLPNGSGVTNMPSEGVKTYGVNYVIPNIIPSRSGYYFLGWQSGNGTQYDPGDSIAGNASFGLRAIWTNEAGYKPKITGSNGTEIPLVVRSDSGGSQDLFGTYALVEFDWQTFASATGAAARLYYKLTSASTWTLAATISPLSGTSGSQSVVIGGGNLDVSKSYNVRIVVEDSTGNTTRFNTTLTMSYMTIDFGGEGKAIGIGTEAPDPTGHANGLMQIAMDAIDANGDPFNGSDRVIGTVTSNGWTCTKWASGKLECEQVGSSSVAFSASGTLYLGTITINLPSIIVSTSSKSIQCESNTYFIYGGGYFTGTTSVTYNVFRAASGTRTLKYIAKVIGTWK